MRKMICQKCNRATTHKRVTWTCYKCTKCGTKVFGYFVPPLDFGQKSIRRIEFWLKKYDAPEAHTTSARVMKALKERQELLTKVKELEGKQSC